METRNIKKAELLVNGDTLIIYHNLPEMTGLSLNDALQNWLARTDKFTAESLCEYIRSKDTGFVAMTENLWNEIHKS